MKLTAQIDSQLHTKYVSKIDVAIVAIAEVHVDFHFLKSKRTYLTSLISRVVKCCTSYGFN